MWVNLSVSLTRRPSGEPDYLVCVAEDITARKLGELLSEPLTPRETEVLRRIAAGWQNPRIAKDLSYGLGAIKLDVRNILAKLGVRDRRRAARAVEIGLLAPPGPLTRYG